LIFQTLDNKNECVGGYFDDELLFGGLPDDLTHTWGWAPYLPDGVEYASVWCGGKPPGEVCPSHLADEWEMVDKKLQAFYRSFVFAKIDLDEHCFFDLVPRQFLINYCKIKNQICEWVFKTYERPENHDVMVAATAMFEKMKKYRINMDHEAMRRQSHSKQVRIFSKKMENYDDNIVYHPYGSITGRLTTSKKSFPILRLEKDMRHFLKPNNDWFVEFDYNAADLRSFFYILGKKQPDLDIHEWNIKNIFGSSVPRDMAKRMMFSWLYDLGKKDQKLEKVYGRDYILRTYWDGEKVTNPFGRIIKADKEHAISYLVQSTTADYVLRKMLDIHDLLEGMKTKLAFSIHDSIVIDMDWEERHIIGEILEIMRSDGFVTTASTGKTFGNLEKLKV
jgi:hypothetical protein